VGTSRLRGVFLSAADHLLGERGAGLKVRALVKFCLAYGESHLQF
jgi:hypothetical protein